MSERGRNLESGQNVELDPQQVEELSKNNQERMRKNAEAAAEAQAEAQKNIESLYNRVNEEAKPTKDIEAPHSEINGSEASLLASTHLKINSYKRRLHSVQRQETSTQRAFSKVIHNRVVENVSDAAEGTVARPSGLLFAGIFSAASGLVVLYICRHYGYEYNFLISLVCFVGGFVAGLILEALWRLIRRSSN